VAAKEAFPAAQLWNTKLVEKAPPAEAERMASAGPSSPAMATGEVVGFRRRAEGASQAWVAQQPPVVVVFPISPRSVRAEVLGLVASLLFAEAVPRSLPPARVAGGMAPGWVVRLSSMVAVDSPQLGELARAV
jgi:hypothetical protein